MYHCIASSAHIYPLFGSFFSKHALCCLDCFHSDLENGDLVRIECQIEGRTTVGNVGAIEQEIIDIVSGNAFYIPGSDILSGKSC